MSAPLSIPTLRDPRWLFAGLLTCYAVVGSIALGINRDLWQILLTVSLCVVLDLSFAWLLRRERIFPLSAYITGLGLSLLVNYPHDYYLLCLPAFFAIASKYLFTFQGRHVFNPGLFGVLAALWLGGGRFATSPPYQWGEHPWLAAVFLGLAALACFVGKIQRTPLIVSFLLSFAVLTLLRAWFMRWHLPPETLITGTLASPAFFLFAFYMITDPKTSPQQPRAQILWAVAVALLDFLLHLKSSLATMFIALFLVSLTSLLWHHARRLYQSGWCLLLPSARWLKSTGLLASVGVSGWLLYANVLHATISGPAPGFVLERVPVDEVKLSHTMEAVDPRIVHIAKWVLSVGDAVAVGDYDGDGLQDFFCTYPLKEPHFRNALYHNLGGMKFERVPLPALEETNLHPETHGLISGALFVDFDNSGRQSLVLTCGWGKLRLLQNVLNAAGQISFKDITPQSGIDEYTVSVASTLADFDSDGDLDLFIGNAMATTLPDYAQPTPFNIFLLPAAEYPGDRRMFHFMHSTWHNAENGGLNAFYRNEGNGHWSKQDMVKLGMPETHWTMAVGTVDLNHDGWPDLYCASDYGPDDVYLNDAGKGFHRVAGAFHGSVGKDSYKGMNVSIGDLDNSGEMDVYVSNVHAPLQAEGSLCWHVNTKGIADQASPRRLVNEQRFGWGAAMGDLNLDGHLDLVQVNGMVDDTADRKFPERQDYWYRASQVMRAGPDVHSYADRWADLRGYDIWGHQQNRVYLSNGASPAQFRDVADLVGLTEKTNSRAVALADLDNDGDLDAIITHQYATADLLRNTSQETKKKHWIGFLLAGDGHHVNRDAVGAIVELRNSAGLQRREVSLTSGFSAQSDRRLHFGLAASPEPVTIDIRWPNGKTQRLEKLPPNQYHRLNYPASEFHVLAK
jgi:hypothetical protein